MDQTAVLLSTSVPCPRPGFLSACLVAAQTTADKFFQVHKDFQIRAEDVVSQRNYAACNMDADETNERLRGLPGRAGTENSSAERTAFRRNPALCRTARDDLQCDHPELEQAQVSPWVENGRPDGATASLAQRLAGESIAHPTQ